MYDFEARHVIEALRSGVLSRAVGQYFSEARPRIVKEISNRLDAVCEHGKSGGMVISGKYGEGKTHLLNTVFNLAHSDNMVVSYLSLSKETPMDKLYLVYQKLVQNTYLPMRRQPGFMQELEKISANSPAANEMLLYAAKHLLIAVCPKHLHRRFLDYHSSSLLASIFFPIIIQIHTGRNRPF